MPLILKDCNWQQTENTVTVHVPLHGVHQSKVDIFTSSKYIKATYEKYFFEIFLKHAIATDTSKCTIINNSIIFELVKQSNELWDALEDNIPKTEKTELRKKIIEEEHQNYQTKCKEKQQLKSELKRTAVQEQISVETQQRKLIEDIKEKEKKKALGDLKNWQSISANSSSDSIKGSSNSKTPTRKDNKTENKKSIPVIPRPRGTVTVEVEFTPREFPTPCRESRMEEENEWLKKQAEARRSAGFVSEDLRPEEKNPQYLLEKGNEFLKRGNYLGAISAYSFGIKLSEKYADLYTARARAQFAIGNYNKAIHDCSTALDLMKPETSANLLDRSECICRRGVALCKVGLVEQGQREITAALSLNGDKEKLQNIISCLNT